MKHNIAEQNKLFEIKILHCICVFCSRLNSRFQEDYLIEQASQIYLTDSRRVNNDRLRSVITVQLDETTRFVDIDQLMNWRQGAHEHK